MARYVLLEFDDNDEAASFTKLLTSDPVTPQRIRVLGVYFKPTQFCECPNPGDRSALGEKYGLWIHRDCGKPKRGHTQHPRNLLIDQETWKKMPSKEKVRLYLGVLEGVES